MPKPRIPCKGFRDYSLDHIEYACDYDMGVDCEHCVINGGHLSPATGKPFRGNPELYREGYEKRFGSSDTPGILKLNGITLRGLK